MVRHAGFGEGFRTRLPRRALATAGVRTASTVLAATGELAVGEGVELTT